MSRATPGPSPLVVDGSHGEGGGQILRNALALSAMTGRALSIENIRAGRPRPGLAAQHLTAIRAVARLCDARVAGDALGSLRIEFSPRRRVRAGAYLFDVAEAREGGSAGAVTLVMQAILVPLAQAEGRSTVVLRGGTHVAWSPSLDFAREVWLPALNRMGVDAQLELVRWGWYPAGRGEARAAIAGRAGTALVPIAAIERGALRVVRGRAVTANLPAHIAQRMASRASSLLSGSGLAADIAAEHVRAASPGAGLFLCAEYERTRAGFSALGAPGKPSETVAEEVVAEVAAFHRSGAAVDSHLADQLIVPAALAAGESRLCAARATGHLATCAWLVELFGLARVRVAESEDGVALVSVLPFGHRVG